MEKIDDMNSEITSKITKNMESGGPHNITLEHGDITLNLTFEGFKTNGIFIKSLSAWSTDRNMLPLFLSLVVIHCNKIFGNIPKWYGQLSNMWWSMVCSIDDACTRIEGTPQDNWNINNDHFLKWANNVLTELKTPRSKPTIPPQSKSAYNCNCTPGDNGEYGCRCSGDRINLEIESISKKTVGSEEVEKRQNLMDKIKIKIGGKNTMGYNAKLDKHLKENADLKGLNEKLLSIGDGMTLTDQSVELLIERLDKDGGIKPYNYVLKFPESQGGGKKSRRKSRRKTRKTKKRRKISKIKSRMIRKKYRNKSRKSRK
jgi:hypothetical protein